MRVVCATQLTLRVEGDWLLLTSIYDDRVRAPSLPGKLQGIAWIRKTLKRLPNTPSDASWAYLRNYCAVILCE